MGLLIGLGSASSTEYSSLLESASGKAAQNEASIAAAKALQEATTKDSEDKIIHFHEVMQLELKAQSQELSKTHAQLEERE